MSAEPGSIVAPGQQGSHAKRARVSRVVRWSSRWRQSIQVAVAVAVAVGAGMLLEASAPWHSVTAALESLGFDQARIGLISAWVASATAAAIAAALSRRVAVGVLCGTALFVVGYELGWSAELLAHPPNLPGIPETLATGTLVMNLVTMGTASVVLNFIAAASGQSLRYLMVGTAGGDPLRSRGNDARWGTGWIWRGIAIALLAGSLLATVRGVDPLLRYGPDHLTYVPLPAAPAAGTAPIQSMPGSPAPTATPGPGQLLYRTFDSQSMGGARTFGLYLPPGYTYYARRQYPLLVLLHGDPGSAQDWGRLGIKDILDSAINRDLIPPFIAVMPDGNGTVTGATQWANRRDGRDQVESSVLELVRLIDQDYRTLTDPSHRLIAGLSSGGFGAANFAARHPNQFGIAISLSGYFVAQGPVFGGDAAYIAANSPFDHVRDQASARAVDYLLVVGESDGSYLWAAKQFATELAQLHVQHTLRLLPGAHEARIWTTGLLVSLEQLKTQLWPVAPSPKTHLQ